MNLALTFMASAQSVNILDWFLSFFVAVPVAAMLELGSLLGAFIAGTFADRFSRRQSIVVACGGQNHLLACAIATIADAQ